MIGSNRIAVAFTNGVMHPVFTLWPLALADELERWLETDDKRRVRAFIERNEMEAVEFAAVETEIGPLDPFFNINTPADLEAAERWLPLVEDMER